MAGIINHQARILTFFGTSNGASVALQPGFNIVDDEAWENCLKNPLTKQFINREIITCSEKPDKETIDDQKRLQAEHDAEMEKDLAARKASVSMDPNGDVIDPAELAGDGETEESEEDDDIL